MKKLALMFALSLFGTFAHAETPEVQALNDNTEIQVPANEIAPLASPAWVCGLSFTGTSKGIKVLFGHFTTTAYGHLHCKGIFGGNFHRNVMVTIGHHWFSPSVGIGYFKFAGIATEISLFNCSPEAILGKYKIAEADAAVIAGAGTFTAVKVGLPQLAVAVSLKLLLGIGFDAGIDKMRIDAI
ncbi:MAG: hypothetical protein ACXVCP_01945 [Bdellovibrio sp.]